MTSVRLHRSPPPASPPGLLRRCGALLAALALLLAVGAVAAQDLGTIAAGSSATLTRAQVQLAGPLGTAPLFGPPLGGMWHGTITRDGVALSPSGIDGSGCFTAGDTFTLAEIDAGRIAYQNNGTSGSFSFSFPVFFDFDPPPACSGGGATYPPATVTVTPPPNTPPTIDPIGDRTTDSYSDVAVSFRAADAEDATLSYSLGYSDASLLQDYAFSTGGTTPVLTVRPMPGTSGTTTLTVTARDSRGDTASTSFDLTVTAGSLPALPAGTYDFSAANRWPGDSTWSAVSGLYFRATPVGGGTVGVYDTDLYVNDSTGSVGASGTLRLEIDGSNASAFSLGSLPIRKYGSNDYGYRLDVTGTLAGGGTVATSGTTAVGDAGYTSAPDFGAFRGITRLDITVTSTAAGSSLYNLQLDSLELVAANRAPSFGSSPVAGATEEASYSYTVAVDDPDGDALTLSAPTLPSWLTFTPSGNGTAGAAATLSGTPDDAHVGDHAVVLSVSDGEASVTQSFTVTVAAVDDPPVLGGIPLTPNLVDTASTMPFAPLTVGDVDSASLTATVSLDSAAKGALSGGGFGGSGGSVSFSGSPAAVQSALDALTFTPAAGRLNPGASESATLTLTVTDGTTPRSASSTITVRAPSASLAGAVYLDRDDDGVRDGGEPGVDGVTLRLTGTDDLSASVDRSATTSGGAFLFSGLRPGSYALTETQPSDLLDAAETVGSAGGSAGADTIGGIVLADGAAATGYLFGEYAPTPVAFEASSYRLLEGGGWDGAALRLVRSGDLARAASVRVTVSAAGATPGSDLSSGPFDVAFGSGVAAVAVPLVAIDDDVDEGDEGFTLTLNAPGGAASLGTPGSTGGTVVDDDSAGISVTRSSSATTEAGAPTTVTVVLDSEPTADVTVVLSVDDASEAGLSSTSLVFTSANWDTPQQVTLTGRDDDVADGDVAYALAFTVASGDPNYDGDDPTDLAFTNLDDDTARVLVTTIGSRTGEDGSAVDLQLVLTSEPVADVTVALSVSDASEAMLSITSLTFTAANWDTPQQATVTGRDDAVADGDTPFTVDVAVSSADPVYDGNDPDAAELTNDDDDSVGVAVTVSGDSTTEAGGSATLTVALDSEPTADVTVALAVSDTGEAALSGASLLFPPGDWNTPQTVIVTGLDDDRADGDVAYRVTPTTSSGDAAYDGLAPTPIALTNRDDDRAEVRVAASGDATGEDGSSVDLTVTLGSEPVTDVTVDLTASDAGEADLSDASLVFTPANWDVPQVVTVVGRDDTVDDGDVAYRVVVSVASADGDYDALAVPAVALTNRDDDAAGLLLEPAGPLTLREGGAGASYALRLASIPVAPVEIALDGLAGLDLGAGAGAARTLRFAADASALEPLEITVLALDDADVQGGRSLELRHVATSDDPAYDGTEAMLALSVSDNDAALTARAGDGQPEGPITVRPGDPAAVAMHLRLDSAPGSETVRVERLVFSLRATDNLAGEIAGRDGDLHGLERVRLVLDVDGDGAPGSDDPLLGSAVRVDPETGTVVFVLDRPLDLTGGESLMFLLVLDPDSSGDRGGAPPAALAALLPLPLLRRRRTALLALLATVTLLSGCGRNAAPPAANGASVTFEIALAEVGVVGLADDTDPTVSGTPLGAPAVRVTSTPGAEVER